MMVDQKRVLDQSYTRLHPEFDSKDRLVQVCGEFEKLVTQTELSDVRCHTKE